MIEGKIHSCNYFQLLKKKKRSADIQER